MGRKLSGITNMPGLPHLHCEYMVTVNILYYTVRIKRENTGNTQNSAASLERKTESMFLVVYHLWEPSKWSKWIMVQAMIFNHGMAIKMASQYGKCKTLDLRIVEWNVKASKWQLKGHKILELLRGSNNISGEYG